ncbi:MAG: rod-binding protein [Clostridia bacterium]|jgi:flagellar protein FlgJ|nr:rod-binding protein [Clostridia bacterium]
MTIKIDFPVTLPMAADKAVQQKSHQETDTFARMLERAKEKNNDQELKEACLQFETYFLQQMMQGMRATVPQSGFIPKSYAREIYEGMLDEQYAEKMSQAGGIGLAKLLYDDLTRRR